MGLSSQASGAADGRMEVRATNDVAQRAKSMLKGAQEVTDERVMKWCRELEAEVERPDVPLSSLLRKSIRLAQLVDDIEYRTLFEMHLTGHLPGRVGPGLGSWPAGQAARWPFADAFMDDRRRQGNAGILAFPIEQIEGMRQRFKDILRTPGAQLPPGQWDNAIQMETELGTIVGHVRNRVSVFLGEVEAKFGATAQAAVVGTKVFIGHGGSSLWQTVRDWLTEKNIPWDEFNREPTAGVPTTDRLGVMLDEAAVALLIMTAEDQNADGTKRARENVVHEVGLFQGRLGFRKAIVLLEEGCNEFSNITGLGQIRFSSGRIEEAFEQLEAVLVREGIVSLGQS